MVSKAKVKSLTHESSSARQRAAIYLRVSTEGGYGLAVQEQETQAYALASGLEVVLTFIDEGISGTKDASERSGLAAALLAARDRQFDVLVAPAVDRLARRTELLLAVRNELEQAGVTIVTVKEKLDTGKPTGRRMWSLYAKIAEIERDTIVARTTAGRDERGKVDGEKGGQVPYGYFRQNDGTIAVNEDAARIVRLIFGLRAAGETLMLIAERLNTLHIPTPRAVQARYSTAKWYASTVKSVLDNEHAYRGGLRGESPITWQSLLEA